MVIGSRTFSGDLVVRLGLVHLLAAAEDRYPRREVTDLTDLGPDLVLLPDEPYPFASDDGPEAFPDVPTALVSGRDLTWYGPSLATSRADLTAAVRSALGPG
jgi:hypothetical protein